MPTIEELQEKFNAGEISKEDYDVQVAGLYEELEATSGRPEVTWKDRLAGGGLGLTSGAFYGLGAGGPPGAVFGGIIGGGLGAAFPPQSLADVGMMVVPGAIGQGARRVPQVSRAMTQFGQRTLPQMGNVGRAGVRIAQGAGEGLAEHAGYTTARSLEAALLGEGKGMPSGRELLPQNLMDYLGVGGAALFRGVPEMTSRRAFMESPGVGTAEGARLLLGQEDLQKLRVRDVSPDAMTSQGQAQLREAVGSNEAELRRIQSANRRTEIELRSQRDKVAREQRELSESLEKDYKTAMVDYEVETKTLTGELQITDKYLRRVDERIAGLRGAAKETKGLNVQDYVAKSPQIRQIEGEIAFLEDQIQQLETGKLKTTTRQRELSAQSTKTDLGEIEISALEMTPAPTSPTTGRRMDPYTTHPERFGERIDLLGTQLDTDTQVKNLRAQLSQAEKMKADAVAQVTREAQEKYLTTNNPAVQKALKERAALRATQTKQQKRLAELEVQQVGQKKAALEGQHYAKYKSALTSRFDSLNEEIVETQLANEFINQRVVELKNSPNQMVRNFAWATDPEARWRMIANAEDGYETTRQLWTSMGSEQKDVFKTWFYERMARALYDDQRGLLSKAEKVFGANAEIDHRTLALVTGSEDAAQDMIALFRRIEQGTQSVWDNNNFVKKAMNHLAYHTPIALLFYPSKVLVGGAVGGAILAGTSWPKMFHHMAENPKMRQEMMHLMEDGGGAVNARLYPILAKFIFEQAHPIGIEEEEGAD